MTAVRPFSKPDDSPIEVDLGDIGLFEALEEGDREAIGMVYMRVSELLRKKAATLIPAHLRAKIEPESVVVSAIASIMDDSGQECLRRMRITNWGQLFGLLARITVRKCLNRIRCWHAKMRDARRERQLEEAASLATESTAEAEVLFAELLKEVESHFKEVEQQIIHLSMENRELIEIADAVQKSTGQIYTTTYVKNVRRKVSHWLNCRLQEEANRQGADDDK